MASYGGRKYGSASRVALWTSFVLLLLTQSIVCPLPGLDNLPPLQPFGPGGIPGMPPMPTMPTVPPIPAQPPPHKVPPAGHPEPPPGNAMGTPPVASVTVPPAGKTVIAPDIAVHLGPVTKPEEDQEGKAEASSEEEGTHSSTGKKHHRDKGTHSSSGGKHHREKGTHHTAKVSTPEHDVKVTHPDVAKVGAAVPSRPHLKELTTANKAKLLKVHPSASRYLNMSKFSHSSSSSALSSGDFLVKVKDVDSDGKLIEANVTGSGFKGDISSAQGDMSTGFISAKLKNGTSEIDIQGKGEETKFSNDDSTFGGLELSINEGAASGNSSDGKKSESGRRKRRDLEVVADVVQVVEV